jgi:uncharacterized protein
LITLEYGSVCADSTRGAPASNGNRRNFDGYWPRTPGRILGVSLIRLYQLTLSGFIGQACRHQPTCSEYAYESVARFGLIGGGWLSLQRVLRCNPFGASGFDPVPEKMSWWG